MIAVTEFRLIPEGFSMGPNRRRARGGAASQRYAKQVADPGWFKRDKCEWK